MSGSAAEERIRAKAEAALRAVWPDGRIIHELMLAQQGCRIDLACVTPNLLIVVEVKSEKDVLDRLERQAKEARRVADGFFVALAEKHWRKAWEGRHISSLEACREDEIESDMRRLMRRVLERPCNSPARLEMLWASELRRIADGKSNATRPWSIKAASDQHGGAEIRRRVCAALRARHFPRADPPVLSELFPQVSRAVK